jgi:hypothetical protein
MDWEKFLSSVFCQQKYASKICKHFSHPSVGSHDRLFLGSGLTKSQTDSGTDWIGPCQFKWRSGVGLDRSVGQTKHKTWFQEFYLASLALFSFPCRLTRVRPLDYVPRHKILVVEEAVFLLKIHWAQYLQNSSDGSYPRRLGTCCLVRVLFIGREFGLDIQERTATVRSAVNIVDGLSHVRWRNIK